MVAEHGEGDGVAAALGEEVAAEAEHVRPPAQPRYGLPVPAGLRPRGGDRSAAQVGQVGAQPGRLAGAQRGGQVGGRVVRSAEPPAGVDEAFGVAAVRVGVQVDGVVGEPVGGVAGDLGGLGGVLGQVGGDLGVGDLAVGGRR